MEKVSCFLSRVLDNIGYDSRMISLRKDAWREYARKENSMKWHQANRHLILAGSKAEGITLFYESDIDHMFVLTDVVCADEVEGIPNSADLSMFKTDFQNTPPGYTKLKLEQLNRGRDTKLMNHSLFSSADDHTYISSTFYMDEQRKEIMRIARLSRQNKISHKESVGPALPVSAGRLKADMVSGLFYRRPKSLQCWSRRHRSNKWPPADVIADIATGNGQVVPIGCNGSDTQFQDWRVCFVDSELTLLQTLSHTQIKVYILLKLIAKHALYDVCPNITSFIMKNVCFWIAELHPANLFTEDKLIPLLLSSLTFLKRCIFDWNHLPYYMIPERNLLAGKIQFSERQQLSTRLMELMSEGPHLVLRCPKIRNAICNQYETPEHLTAFSLKRNELEILKIQHVILSIAKQYGEDTGGECGRLRLRIADIVLPEWKVLRHKGADVNVTVMKRIQQFLS